MSAESESLVWWLDDGQENIQPDLYATREAAVEEAERPFAAVHTAKQMKWLPLDGEQHAFELLVHAKRTGIVVRGLHPKALAAERAAA